MREIMSKKKKKERKKIKKKSTADITLYILPSEAMSCAMP